MTNEAGTTVLVPGAAGSSAIGAIKALRHARFDGRIIATDGETLSAGFFLSDRYYVTNTITDVDAYGRVVDMLVREKVTVILPTSASETPVYALRKPDLQSMGIVFAGADEPVIKLCDDKLQFHYHVRDHFPVPTTVTTGEAGPDNYPCFVKPRFGSGSHGCGVCHDVHDWMHFSKGGSQLLTQEILPGKEYSVDVLSDLDGHPLTAIPRERVAIIDGVSVRAKVVRSAEIENLCLQMAQYLCIKGACCMQLKQAADGQLKFLEVNVRLGGSNIVSTLAGVNIPRYLLAMALGEQFAIPPYREITVVRHFDEIVVQ